MSGCKECVPFKGEATRLLKSWEPYKSLKVSAVFYENLWYSATRILCALFSTSILTTKCTWHDFACIIWVKGTLAFWDLCLVMKRRNQNIQVTQERKLIKLPSHECNLFVWKDKGWNIPTDSQSLCNHRAGKHMNMPGKKFSIPGASANKGEGNFSTNCVLPTPNFRDLCENFTRFPLIDRRLQIAFNQFYPPAWNMTTFFYFISLQRKNIQYLYISWANCFCVKAEDTLYQCFTCKPLKGDVKLVSNATGLKYPVKEWPLSWSLHCQILQVHIEGQNADSGWLMELMELKKWRLN